MQLPVYSSGKMANSAHNVSSTYESFFATLKNEMYYRESFATRDQAKMAVIDFIERYYNRSRPHSTIGYRVPAEVMDAFFEKTLKACEVLPFAA